MLRIPSEAKRSNSLTGSSGSDAARTLTPYMYYNCRQLSWFAWKTKTPKPLKESSVLVAAEWAEKYVGAAALKTFCREAAF
jgi:hypothetical protein